MTLSTTDLRQQLADALRDKLHEVSWGARMEADRERWAREGKVAGMDQLATAKHELRLAKALLSAATIEPGPPNAAARKASIHRRNVYQAAVRRASKRVEQIRKAYAIPVQKMPKLRAYDARERRIIRQYSDVEATAFMFTAKQAKGLLAKGQK